MPWTRLTQPEINALFARQRAADPIALRFHLFFALAFLFLSGWPTTWVDIAGLCLLLMGTLRICFHHYILGPLVWDPISRLTLAWSAWIALSGFWSFGTWKNWAGDAGSLRYAVAIPLLYPVIQYRRFLITALALGLICGQLSQLSHFLGLQFHLPALTWHRDPNRISGWWDPVVAGSLLCAALGLQLGFRLPLPEGGGWGGVSKGAGNSGYTLLRRASLLLIPLTLLALLATGTRGAWIAAAILLVIGGIGILANVHSDGPNTHQNKARRARPFLLRPRTVLVTLILLLTLAATTTLLLPKLRARFNAGYHEVARALEHRDYTTDTGQRLSMWIWAGRAFQHNPLLGVGAGGYKPFATSYSPPSPAPGGGGPIDRVSDQSGGGERALPTPQPASPDRAASSVTPSSPLPPPHNHAHSFYLHTAATLGLPGLIILFSLLTTAILPIRRHPATSLALLGLCLAGLFDTIHVNQQTANLLYILLALNIKLQPDPHPGAITRPQGPQGA